MPNGESWTVPNEDVGWQALVPRRLTRAPTLVGLEATGGFESPTVAALVGVAPRKRDSGTLRGRRLLGGGRAPVRAALYMAALAGLRWNPVLRQFYTRLRTAGKPFNVAVTACMRQLLVILNTIMRQQQPWNAKHA